MKKSVYILLAAAVACLAIFIVLNPSPATGSGKASSSGPGTSLPDSVYKVVQKACMDCHSDDGSGMARGKVNFSQWQSYDQEKQMKKAADICKELTKSGMPPKKWRANNPNDIPTQAETDMICKWAKSLEK